MNGDRAARALHPMAWWVWALGLVVAVSRMTNPLLLGAVLAALAFVVASRRADAPWARAFRYYLVLAGIVIAIRVVFRSLFTGGVAPTDHVLFTLPQVDGPSWYSGVHLGGPVSLEAVLAATTDGLRLGTLLCCVGAANVLANPKRALRVLPGALYELGVAVVVALSVAPQLVESAQRVRRARALRPSRARGIKALRPLVIPVLEDALDRSLQLAAGMDSRGYGRTGSATPTSRRLTAGLMLLGMCGLSAGAYGLLDATTPALLGLPTVLTGVVLCCAGFAFGGRRVHRTAYRPDPWRHPEWIVAGGGVACAAGTLRYDGTGLDLSVSPLTWPTLPLLPLGAILLAVLAALAAPPPVRRRPVPRRADVVAGRERVRA